MKVLTYLFLTIACFITFVQAKDSDLMKDLTFKTSSGTTLKYLLFTPKDYDASKKYPLVVTLHSMGSDYKFQVDNNDQAHPWIEDSVQAKWPCFIMAPNSPSGSTWGGMMGAGTALSSECKAVYEAVEDLKKKYSLDTTRFIVGGFSIGGAGTYHMIQFLPNYWAAACPVAAGGAEGQIEIISKTPIWHHHGSADNNGAALTRMSDALIKIQKPVFKITCTMVISANGNGPANWTNEINKGTTPQNIIYKNAKPTYDSVSKAVDAGANYIFQLITNANHEDSRINANHNPLLAKWAFSKRKGGPAVAIVPVPSRTTVAYNNNVSRTVLTTGNVSPATYVNNQIFTLLGQSDMQQPVSGNSSVILRVYKPTLKK
jgi:poly(3-hydroxybutyrate) depolymerase